MVQLFSTSVIYFIKLFIIKSNNKHIIVSIPWFTPAFKAGGPVQSVLNMVELLKDDFSMDIVSANTDIDGSRLENITSNKKIPFSEKVNVLYLNNSGILRSLFRILREKKRDVLFVNGIYSFYFTLFPILFFRGKRIILSARGMLHPPALNQKKHKKIFYLLFLKPLLMYKKVEYHATDETEASYIRNIMGNNSMVWVAPNIPRFLDNFHVQKKSRELNLITVALISPMKNHLLILESLKSFKEKIDYDIIGPVFDEDYWVECKKCIEELPSNIKVNYLGPASPMDIGKYFSTAHVFICPSQSENFGHAFFEAFSAGKPVITSHQTPWNGLENSEIGLNVNIKEVEMTDAIRKFLDMDDATYQKWSSNARNFADQYVDFKGAKNQYLKMFHESI